MSYAQQWNDYKKRSRLYWLGVMIFVLALAVGLPLVITFHNDVLFYFYIIALGIAGIAVNIYGYHRSFWKCPRCGEPFFRSQKWRGTMLYPIFARQCQNCGLPKWAENDSPD